MSNAIIPMQTRTIESAGEMALELSSTENEILEFQTTIERTTKFEHVGTRPNDRA